MNEAQEFKPLSEAVIFEKYPKLFRQKDMSLMDSAMCWGLQCDSGWYWLIDAMCGAIQFNCDFNKTRQVEFTTVKEKYGQLIVYWNFVRTPETFKDECRENYDSGLIEGIINSFEVVSNHTCEVCGNRGFLCHHGSWVKTLCFEHAEKLDYAPGDVYFDYDEEPPTEEDIGGINS